MDSSVVDNFVSGGTVDEVDCEEEVVVVVVEGWLGVGGRIGSATVKGRVSGPVGRGALVGARGGPEGDILWRWFEGGGRGGIYEGFESIVGKME